MVITVNGQHQVTHDYWSMFKLEIHCDMGCLSGSATMLIIGIAQSI